MIAVWRKQFCFSSWTLSRSWLTPPPFHAKKKKDSPHPRNDFHVCVGGGETKILSPDNTKAVNSAWQRGLKALFLPQVQLIWARGTAEGLKPSCTEGRNRDAFVTTNHPVSHWTQQTWCRLDAHNCLCLTTCVVFSQQTEIVVLVVLPCDVGAGI